MRGFWLTIAVAGSAFLLFQALLAVHNWAELHRESLRGFLPGAPVQPMANHVLIAVIAGALAYGGVTLAGTAIAAHGHRLLFALPVACLVLLPIVGAPHTPRPLGTEWNVVCTFQCPIFGNWWVGGTIDLILVLAPALVLTRAVPARRWLGTGDASALAGVGLAVGLVILVHRTTASVNGQGPDVPAFVAVAAFGVAVGMGRRWWPWAHLLVTAAFTGALSTVVWIFATPSAMAAPGSRWEAIRFTLEDLIPFVAAVLIAACWEPMAGLLRKASARPLLLVIAVNALNVTDALLTVVAVRSGGAAELNPLVRIGGIPLKLALVGALTWLLYRRRPAALMWPTVALAWVACYHLSGIVVNH